MLKHSALYIFVINKNKLILDRGAPRPGEGRLKAVTLKNKVNAVPGSLSGGGNREVLSLLDIVSSESCTTCVNAFTFHTFRKKNPN